MANVKIYTNKASITRWLKTAGITTIMLKNVNIQFFNFDFVVG